MTERTTRKQFAIGKFLKQDGLSDAFVCIVADTETDDFNRAEDLYSDTRYSNPSHFTVKSAEEARRALAAFEEKEKYTYDIVRRWVTDWEPSDYQEDAF
jgi:hypothetical protein